MKYEYYSKEILKDKSLTDATKCVANHLIHIAGWEKDNVLPSIHSLENILSIDRKEIRKALKVLKSKYIIVNDDNTFTFQINGIKFNKQDLKNAQICHLFGDFVKVPQCFNYQNNALNGKVTPSMRIAAIMYFDFNFDIDKSGNILVKKNKVNIKNVAAYYGINENTFKTRLQKCKKVKLIDFITAKQHSKTTNSGIETVILKAKVYTYHKEWVPDSKMLIKESDLYKPSKKEQKEEKEEQKQWFKNNLLYYSKSPFYKARFEEIKKDCIATLGKKETEKILIGAGLYKKGDI